MGRPLCAFVRVAVPAMLCMSWVQDVDAQTNAGSLDWGLSIRTRFESKQDFNFVNSSQDYFLTQTRFRLSWQPNDQSNLFLELQDARVAGEDEFGIPRVNDKANGTVFADELDIHQAFWDRKLVTGRLRVGRQKLNLGDSRLVASLEWVNTARVHDGVRFTWGNTDQRQFDVFATALVAVDPDGFNDRARIGNRYLDSKFHGIYVTDRASLSQAELHYWYLYRRNGRFGDEVGTLGARFVQNSRTWRPDIQFAWQDGDFDGRDHSAWMVHAGLAREIGDDVLGASYSFASGDPFAADNKHETFDNLFPLNHPYYGYMDLFSLQNVSNIEVSYRKRFTPDTVLYLALNDFSLARSRDAWYSAGLAPIRVAENGADRHIGSEVDIAIQTKFLRGRVDFSAGISMLRGGSYLDSFGLSGSAKFFYASFRYAVQGSND